MPLVPYSIDGRNLNDDALPVCYLHPRGLPSQKVHFDLWERYKRTYETLAPESHTFGAFADNSQTDGKKSPRFSYSIVFDEWAITPPPGLRQEWSGAHIAWLWLDYWLGDGGTDVDNVFVMKLSGFENWRYVTALRAEVSDVEVNDGYVLRFKCEFSGRHFTETFIDPALFGKPRRPRKKKNLPKPAPVIPMQRAGLLIEEASAVAGMSRSGIINSLPLSAGTFMGAVGSAIPSAQALFPRITGKAVEEMVVNRAPGWETVMRLWQTGKIGPK